MRYTYGVFIIGVCLNTCHLKNSFISFFIVGLLFPKYVHCQYNVLSLSTNSLQSKTLDLKSENLPVENSLFTFSVWNSWQGYVILIGLILIFIYLLRRNELRKLRVKQEKELQEIESTKMKELNQEKSKFFSNISHEFKTPLTLIIGPLERLIKNSSDAIQKAELNKIRRNARRLQSLISQHPIQKHIEAK